MLGKKILFCKKICDIKNPVSFTDFDFRSFGHFDGFFVKDVHLISDFSDIREKYKFFGSVPADQNTRELKEKMFAHTEKQVINCLSVQHNDIPYINNDIFGETEENSKNPIVSVTMVNNYNTGAGNNCEISGVQKALSTIIESMKLAEPNNLTFTVYKTLSIEDYIIVLRSDSLFPISNCLEKLRQDDVFNAVNLYSIVSVDSRAYIKKETRKNLPAETALKASLRLYVYPTVSFERLVTRLKEINPHTESIAINEKGSHMAFTSYGRFDIHILLDVTGLCDLLDLFEALNEARKKAPQTEENRISDDLCAIISTETTLLTNLDKGNKRDFRETNNPLPYSYESIAKKFRASYIENIYKEFGLDLSSKDETDMLMNEFADAVVNNSIDGFMDKNKDKVNAISQELKRKTGKDPLKDFIAQVRLRWGTKFSEPIYLLMERVHQLKHATFSHKYADPLIKFSNAFITDVCSLYENKNINFTSENLNKTIGQIIGNIDNLFSVSFRDFEFSQKDGMQVHPSGKMLIAYRNYVENEFSIAQAISPVDIKDIEICTTVIADIQSNITLDTIPGFDENTSYTDNNIKRIFNIVTIPPTMIYEFGATLFALSHEAGHLITFNENVITEATDRMTKLYTKTNIQNNVRISDAKFKEMAEKYLCDINNRQIAGVITVFNLEPALENISYLLIARIKNIFKKLLKEFAADAYAARSLNFDKRDSVKLQERYYYFLQTISPSHELDGVHIVLRKIAFSNVVLGINLDDIPEYAEYNLNKELTDEFPRFFIDAAIDEIKTFYNDILIQCLTKITALQTEFNSHFAFKNGFIKTIIYNTTNEIDKRKEKFQSFIDEYIKA
jgi:hypothetical protein